MSSRRYPFVASAAQADGFALTPVQAGMAYEVLTQADASVNLEQVVVHFDDEPMDEAAMAKAWGKAIERHAALRLCVAQAGSGPLMQSEAPGFAVPLTVEDWTEMPDRAGALQAWLAQDRKRGVDIAQSGSWRLTWLRHGPRQSSLIWSFSHIALDGRSFQKVLKEVFADYDGAAEVGSRDAPSDFRHHCQTIAEADPAPARRFFAEYLEGFDKPTPLGFATSRPDLAQARVNPVLEARLTVAQTAALRKRAEQAGASFATMVQAAWGLVLARVSGQAEAVFGVTRSGRYLTGASRDMVGCLITTQPLRLSIRPDTTLDALLAGIRADLVAQRPHEALGLADIAAVSGLAQGTALFDSLVMVERQSLNTALAAAGGAWSKRRVALFEQGAMPLTLAAYGDAALLVQLEHQPGRVTGTDAARYLTYVTRLLAAMAAAPPEALLQDLDMLPADETAELLALAKPENPLPKPRPACIASAFEAVAARQPEALALVMAGEEGAGQNGGLSYAALDQRANQLAQFLLQHGIGPGNIVGLCLPRGVDFVALVLATAKAGAAFLPMDPSYPAERLQHMAKDSASAMILTNAAVPWMDGLPVTLMQDALGYEASLLPPDRQGIAPERPAYVIYTSGTTGKPKGVVVSQRSLVAHSLAAIDAYDLSPKDRALQFAALSFDVALEEIVPTLLAGATLILRNDAMIASPQAFAEAVAAEDITVLNLPTGFWQVLLDGLVAGTTSLPSAVRLMIVGGERMPPDALARWHGVPGLPRLINGYGPTEATITCAAFVADGPAQGAEVPVGRSFGHALSYLRAPDGSLAPLAALAELWIGGEAVALGYLNRPKMTAARFQPDRFAGQGRIYQSGDMAHWNENGQLVVAGRSDRQIKLRGFRIEPGEIEVLLENQPGVAQAHVGVVAEQHLVGWLRPRDPEDMPDTKVISAAIATVLPVPQRPELLVVTDWPQTPGGKTDLQQLPAPDWVGQGSQNAQDSAATGPQAMKIAEIFGTVLGREVPGPDTSFFDMGGHSLQMLALIGHIEAAFSARLTVAQVHAQPTPQGLADLLLDQVEVGQGTNLFDCLMPIQPMGRGVPIYGVHVLGVNGSFLRPLSAVMGPDQPVFGLTVGLLSADTPTTVEDIAALYFRAIQAHHPEGPVALLAVSLGSYMALE
ncbi:MAG: amino acid adenylation domain-containing protein, partial [Pseudorhodobacter sp.]